MLISGTRIVAREDALASGLGMPRLMNGILSLDRRCYRDDDPLDIGSIETWLPIFDSWPDTWRALVTNGTVVGYWQIAPLKPVAFDAMLAGRASVRDLRGQDYEDLTISGRYPIYFVSVCLDETARTMAHQFALVSSFMRVRAGLASRGVFFDRVAAHVHSPEGRRLCEVLGLQPATGTAFQHPLFTGSLDNAMRSFKGQLAERCFDARTEAAALAA